MNKKIETTATGLTRAEVEVLAGEIAELKNRQRKRYAEMDAGINEIRRVYAGILTGLDAQIAARVEVAREWAEAHQSEFGGLKSLELAQATIGFRTGRPQLKPAAGWTWNRVLEKAKLLGWAGGFVRTRMELNKQQLLLQREQLGAGKLKELGVRVAREESFFVETRMTAVETRERVAA